MTRVSSWLGYSLLCVGKGSLLRRMSTPDSAVTAAVVGVVLNLAVWFGLHVIFPNPGTVDSFAILIGLVAFTGMVR